MKQLFECTTCLSKFYKPSIALDHVLLKHHKGFRTYKEKELPR